MASGFASSDVGSASGKFDPTTSNSASAARKPRLCIMEMPLEVKLRSAYTNGMSTELADTFDGAFTKAVDLGNKLADRDKDADLWDIADGLLAGAIQYWLYSRQPCGDPRCTDCMPISTAEGRMAELKKLIEQLAAESEYFHTPTDANAGRA